MEILWYAEEFMIVHNCGCIRYEMMQLWRLGYIAQSTHTHTCLYICLRLGVCHVCMSERVVVCTGGRCVDDRTCSCVNSSLCQLTSTDAETVDLSTNSLWLQHLEQMPVHCLYRSVCRLILSHNRIVLVLVWSANVSTLTICFGPISHETFFVITYVGLQLMLFSFFSLSQMAITLPWRKP